MPPPPIAWLLPSDAALLSARGAARRITDELSIMEAALSVRFIRCEASTAGGSGCGGMPFKPSLRGLDPRSGDNAPANSAPAGHRHIIGERQLC